MELKIEFWGDFHNELAGFEEDECQLIAWFTPMTNVTTATVMELLRDMGAEFEYKGQKIDGSELRNLIQRAKDY